MRAAVGYEDASWRPAIFGSVGLLEEAAAALGDQPSKLRVALLGGLSRALDMKGAHDRAAIVRRNAIALARELGDQRELAILLTRSYWARGASSVEEILGDAHRGQTAG